ncbi:hypothetical protein SEA_GREKAYCON_43 [Arthrobacter phage Grekaycon]|uniref:Uncharacterized protein n=5 Tax=Marthavirus TaxID=1980936 RepID=A0A514A5K8_9CAUD|nr:hypothetical protein FDH49_gp43 [Arthrobacter phage Martha]YP_009601753.1 hypothetical protein FDH50_gp43 [Arthrobacter phage Sonny]YP_009612496.1 hypothetical protein FDI42_gp43 [Arthrobacter phage Shade]ALY10500.1 hypothetical protein TAEYOUNG_43 [Arthrobacter phage TaeYoung]ASR80596.1 hypothetical protein SEA_JORDAN_43 [Arthrobacter phage Jordan]KUR65817.1 hypothetical protein JM67_03445 [Arthrobacter sp. ATCC 21022]QDH48533.1 hypothetical protein SEA_GREKAYCON_43 [Arthrobacter phage Gr
MTSEKPLSVADARSALYRIKQARQPITEAIDHLQEHIDVTTKQLEDTRVVDDAMREAEDRAQWALDTAMNAHERKAFGFVDENASNRLKGVAPRKISDNPQA